jgi:hypothetical protein
MTHMSVQFLLTLLKIRYFLLLLFFLLLTIVCLCWLQLHMTSGALLTSFSIVFPGH